MARISKDKNRRNKDNRKNARSDVTRQKERNFKRELAPESSAKDGSPKFPYNEKALEKLWAASARLRPRRSCLTVFKSKRCGQSKLRTFS